MKLIKSFALALLSTIAAGSLIAPAALAQDKKVLMVLWKDETNSEAAFKARLTGLGVKVAFDKVNADQDRGKLANELRTLSDDIKGGKYAAIYSYGTVATQMTKTVAGDAAPIIFNIVFDPVKAKLVDAMDKPGGNVTGVTNGVPIASQFDAFIKLAPIKNLLVFFNSREPNSNYIEEQVSDWAKKNGVTMTSRRVTPDNDSLKEALAEVASGRLPADAVYAGADNYLASVAQEIHDVIGSKVRLYGGTQTYIWRGWLAAYTPLVEDMGANAAEMMAKVLAGANPATMPVVLPGPRLFISKTAADRHGVTPPADAIMEK